MELIWSDRGMVISVQVKQIKAISQVPDGKNIQDLIQNPDLFNPFRVVGSERGLWHEAPAVASLRLSLSPVADQEFSVSGHYLQPRRRLIKFKPFGLAPQIIPKGLNKNIS